MHILHNLHNKVSYKIVPVKDSIKTYLIAVIGGLLMGLAFPPFVTWVLVYPGLMILLHLMVTSGRLMTALKRAYVLIIVLNTITLYWIGSWGSDDMFIKIGGLLTILVHPIFFLLPAAGFYIIYKKIGLLPALVMFPLLWTGFEYFHNLGQLAFPWIELGNTEAYNLNRIQYAEIFGVHGITFYICTLSVLFYYVIIFRPVRSLAYKIAILVLFIAPYVYSIPRVNNSGEQYLKSSDTNNYLSAGIIQTNIDPWKKWNAPVSVIVDSLNIQITESINSFHPQLIVVHETAVPFYFNSRYFESEAARLSSLADLHSVNIILGTPYMHIYNDPASAPEGSKEGSDGRKYDTFNSAVFAEPGKPKEIYSVYKKTRLVPMSERTPYQEYIPFLKNLVKWSVGLSAWQIGEGPKNFTMKLINNDSLKIGTVICFESAFSEYVSKFSNQGAELLVIITNDGWFGNSSGPVQHQMMSVLRAIENRKWIIRAAQTGISCYVDPVGNIYQPTEFGTKRILNEKVIANDEMTFFAKNGDVLGLSSMYISLLAVLASVTLHFFAKKKK